jgi:hypothetical protein
LGTYSVSDAFRSVDKVVSALAPSTVQWIEPPLGNWGFDIVALEHGLKLTNTIHNWGLKNAAPPSPYLRATQDAVDPSDPDYSGTYDFLNTLTYPENLYAFVDTGSRQIPCRASASGGDIDIDCQTGAAGQLTVRENLFPDWKAELDGKRVPLGTGQWLAVAAPAGAHHFEFRFRPWDVPLGWALFLAGLGLSAWLWFSAPKTPVVPHPGG